MAKLIRFPQVDERPTPPAASLCDDSDSWWAGAQRCFVAIPIAATLATVALSASLCWSAQQRNEEIVPQPPPTALAVEEWQKPHSITRPATLSGPTWDDQVPAGSLFGQPEEYPWTVYTPPYKKPKFLYLPDPEETPAGTLFGVPDEVPWIPLGAKQPRLNTRVWSVDDEIVPQAVVLSPDEDVWVPPIIQKQASWRRVWIANEPIALQPAVDDEQNWTKPLSVTRPVRLSGPEWDDQVPAGSLFGQPEDYPWAVWTPPYATPKFVYLPDPEEIPAGTLFGVPEQDTWNRPLVSSPLKPQPLVWADEEIVPQTVALPPDEAAWQLPVTQTRIPWTQVWRENEQSVPPVTAPVEEDVWLPPTIQPQASWRRVWVGNESVVLPPTPEESYWLGYAPPHARPKFLPLWADEEIVPQPVAFGLEEEYWLQPGPRQPRAITPSQAVDDEIVPQAVVLPPEHEAWPLPTSRPQPVQAQVWSVDEEIVPQPTVFTFTDDPLWSPVVTGRALWAKVWWANDEVVVPPVPLNIDEVESWPSVSARISRTPDLSARFVAQGIDEDWVPGVSPAPVDTDVWHGRRRPDEPRRKAWPLPPPHFPLKEAPPPILTFGDTPKTALVPQWIETAKKQRPRGIYRGLVHRPSIETPAPLVIAIQAPVVTVDQDRRKQQRRHEEEIILALVMQDEL